MTVAGYITIAGVVALAAAAVLLGRRRTRETMEKLSQMLDAAMNGTFTEKEFDESMLSALESKWAQYLSASAVSSKNLKAEKDAVKTLITDISHQIKTPIANILLYSQLLSERELDRESRHCAAALESQAQKLNTLVEALVKLSRLESGVLTLRPEPGGLAPVISAAADQILPKAQAKGQRLILERLEAGAVFDPKWTEEAIFNLLDNAVKYTPAGGEIRLSTAVYQFFSCVTVSDTGPGIPEAEQAQIFQRFYRGTEYQNREGVGIGLYLVRQIAEGQGGYVRLCSSAGQGAAFSLYLPKE